MEKAGPGGSPHTWTVTVVNRPDRWIELERPHKRVAVYQWRMGWTAFADLRKNGKLTRVP